MPDRSGKPRILLLGWDAADWQVLMPLVEQGLMPSLAGLMARGAWGHLASLQPMISPMLWTTIATGMTADRHGVLEGVNMIVATTNNHAAMAMSIRRAAAELIDGFREALRSRGAVELDEEVYGDAAALTGVSRYVARVKCAMLAWVALEDALRRA